MIVGDNDRKNNGKWPGKSGATRTAQAIANKLERTIKWAFPPAEFKDVREWLNRNPNINSKQVFQCLSLNAMEAAPEAPFVDNSSSREVLVFSNFEFGESNGKPIKVGLMADNILDILRPKSGGYPKCLNGNVLFVETPTGELLLLENHHQLFAWIDSFCKVDWAEGSDKITQARFFFSAVGIARHFNQLSNFLIFHD